MIYLNIGSNLDSRLGKRIDNIKYAIQSIKKYGIIILKTSSIYETPSYPNSVFPKFLNIGIKVKSKLTPEDLLNRIKYIEKRIGRVKKVTNFPRVCDIDIIDFKGLVKKTKQISIPHPRLHIRNFVLFPMRDLNPEWRHPITNKKINDLISDLNLNLRIQITRLTKSDIIN